MFNLINDQRTENEYSEIMLFTQSFWETAFSYIIVYILTQFLGCNLANNCTLHDILQSSELSVSNTAKNKINRACLHEAVILIDTAGKTINLKCSILNRLLLGVLAKIKGSILNRMIGKVQDACGCT